MGGSPYMAEIWKNIDCTGIAIMVAINAILLVVGCVCSLWMAFKVLILGL